MKLAAFTAAWGGLLLGLSQAGAAPEDEAAGTYYVRYPRALLAFHVDPWTADVHQIRGLGRGALGDGQEYDVVFEIRGTYRPGAAHTAQGVFLFHRSDTIQQIPWKGMYDRGERTFQWAVVNRGELQLLKKAGPPTEQDRAAFASFRQEAEAAFAAGATNPPSPGASPNTPASLSAPPVGPSADAASQPAAAGIDDVGAVVRRAFGNDVPLSAHSVFEGSGR